MFYLSFHFSKTSNSCSIINTVYGNFWTHLTCFKNAGIMSPCLIYDLLFLTALTLLPEAQLHFRPVDNKSHPSAAQHKQIKTNTICQHLTCFPKRALFKWLKYNSVNEPTVSLLKCLIYCTCVSIKCTSDANKLCHITLGFEQILQKLEVKYIFRRFVWVTKTLSYGL